MRYNVLHSYIRLLLLLQLAHLSSHGFSLHPAMASDSFTCVSYILHPTRSRFDHKFCGSELSKPCLQQSDMSVGTKQSAAFGVYNITQYPKKTLVASTMLSVLQQKQFINTQPDICGCNFATAHAAQEDPTLLLKLFNNKFAIRRIGGYN